MDTKPQSWRPAPHAVSTSLDEETVLLNTLTGRYFLLDAIGQRMWNLLLELGSVEPVARTLANEYEVPEEQLRQDLLDLIQELERNGLLCTTAPESETPL